jgi:hypothetical protein
MALVHKRTIPTERKYLTYKEANSFSSPSEAELVIYFILYWRLRASLGIKESRFLVQLWLKKSCSYTKNRFLCETLQLYQRQISIKTNELCKIYKTRELQFTLHLSKLAVTKPYTKWILERDKGNRLQLSIQLSWGPNSASIKRTCLSGIVGVSDSNAWVRVRKGTRCISHEAHI